MSLLPATDIVANVARSADPQRLQAAVRRLAEASPAETARKDDFAAHVTKFELRTAAAVAPKVDSSPQGSPLALHGAGISEVAQKFEAFLLQSFVEAILPKDDRIFGRGTAGGVWRSMMAEQIGGQLAKTGVIALEKIISRHFGMPNSVGARAASRERLSMEAGPVG